MFPQMRQIQRFVVEAQSAQCERSFGDAEGANGTARGVREVLGEDGCEERSVWE